MAVNQGPNPRPLAEAAGAIPAMRPARLPSAPADHAEARLPGRNTARGPAIGLPSATAPKRAGAGTQLSFIIDSDASIRRFLSLLLQGYGIDTEEFTDAQTLSDLVRQRTPDLVFLDVGFEPGDAADCLAALGAANYRGLIQLTSSRGASVLTQAKAIGQRDRLRMLPVLNKPFETSVIVKMLQDHKLGQHTALAGRVDLGEALAQKWIEFWYQPKIDLRKKQLVGVEAFARVRHPEHGVLAPEAFIPAATDSNLIALSELALRNSLKAGINFAKVGVSLRMAINMPVNALRKSCYCRHRAELSAALRALAGPSDRHQ